MTQTSPPPSTKPLTPAAALGEAPLFEPGDRVRIDMRYPIGHYRVPTYVRGKSAVVQAVIRTPAVNNEEEGFGRNAGWPLHYYRVLIPLAELWPGSPGRAGDGLLIEIFETWLRPIPQEQPKEVNRVHA